MNKIRFLRIKWGDIMGVDRIVFYSVSCDKCKASMEDWEGEIGRLTQNNRKLAENIAREIGFK